MIDRDFKSSSIFNDGDGVRCGFNDLKGTNRLEEKFRLGRIFFLLLLGFSLSWRTQKKDGIEGFEDWGLSE